MTNEEKQLLLIDLCARLPYRPIILWQGKIDTHLTIGIIHLMEKSIAPPDVKPYLRPLSTITKEEEKEFNKVLELELKALEGPEGHTVDQAASSTFTIDFYNRYHFDYRGLIPMGLALEAPEDMYKNE